MSTESPPDLVVQPPPCGGPLLPASAAQPARPWGFWLTLAFGVSIAMAYVTVQSVVVAVAAVMKGQLTDPEAVEALAYNGLVLSLATLLSTPVAVGLSVLFAWIRPGLSVGQYLGLKRVSWKMIALGLLSVLGFGMGYEGLNRLADRPAVPEFMLNAYQTAGWVPLLWVAVVLGAPVVEETFFRGFLFAGWASSRLGGWATVGLTSLWWAAIHLQYDLFDIGYIFGLGLLLGGFRLKTGSLWPPLLMHVWVNLLATLQVAWMVHGANPPPG